MQVSMANSARLRQAARSVISKPAHYGLFLLLVGLTGCASSNWSTQHPQFSPPSPQAHVAVQPLGDAFMLTQAPWFASQLGVSVDSIYGVLSRVADSSMILESKKTWPQAQFLDPRAPHSFAPETQKLDETIYLKVRYPHQGQMFSVNGVIPDYLLLIHEYTIGTDLVKEKFYDYRLANQEHQASKNPQKLSILLSYTWWDNHKQIPLFSSVAEIHHPLAAKPLTLPIFQQVASQIASTCLAQIQRGHP